MSKDKTILSLCDFTGTWSGPYRNRGYNVIQVDLKFGGKSERTKELRSVTPVNFAKAFFEANQ